MAKTLNAIIKLTDNFSAKMEKITGTTEKFSRVTAFASKRNEKMNDSFKNLAKAAAGFWTIDKVADGFKSVAEKAIDGASELEQYKNTLNVVMKDQKLAAQTFAWAVDFANKTPFETDELVEATVKLQSYGIVANKNMNAIGDMAAVMNKSLDQAVEAVADAQTGELERLKEFGITKTMIAKKANEMYRNQQIINNKGQIVDQKKFNEALFSLMQDRFKGGMELQANTFKGTMSTVRGVFSSSLSQMMGISKTGEIRVGSMFDTIKNKTLRLSNTLQKWSDDGTIEEWGRKATKVFNDVDNIVSNQLVPGLKEAGSKFAGLIDWTNRHSGAVKFLGTAYLTYKGYLVGATVAQGAFTLVQNASAIATKGAAAAQFILNAAMNANPVGLVILGITALGVVVFNVVKNFEAVRKAVLGAWEALKKWNDADSKPKGVYESANGNNYSGYVGRNALGTSNWRGGPTAINEHGYEVIDLPQGTRIHDKRASQKLGGGISIAKLADTIIVREEADIDKIANAFVKKLLEQSVNMA